MEEHQRVRLGQILWRSRLREWDRKGIEERCEGWWPSLALFVAEQLVGRGGRYPRRLCRVDLRPSHNVVTSRIICGV